MVDKPTIRVFISSPDDVRPERLLAKRIISRLDREFSHLFHVEAVLWEREPLVATYDFQDPRNIPEPHLSDVVVVILWSKLGLTLREERYRGAISGKPVTGTEWEFEDALKSARERGAPALMLYRKTKSVTASLDNDAELEQLRHQKRLVEDFIIRWFGQAARGFTAASHSFRTAEEFEQQLYDHLRAILERRAGDVVPLAAVRWHQEPFRGLLSFDVEHAPVFFGRTQARNELREMLAAQEKRGCAFLLVMGASGSGKSSLVKAGLLPDIMLPGMVGRVALCRYAVLRPTDYPVNPTTSLAAAILSETALPELTELAYNRDRLTGLLAESPQLTKMAMEQGLAAASRAAQLSELGEARLVIIVDQLEELFTMKPLTDAKREAFVSALSALAHSGLVWVVATMRIDFFDRLESSPAMAELADRNARYLLLPPSDAELGQMIREPAREAGLRFEIDPATGTALDDALREAAARDRNALPLLSFLLDQLWRRRTDRGLLTFDAYHALRGFEGALARRAEEVFESQPDDVKAALPRILRALVSVGRDGQVAAKSAELSRFGTETPERRLIEAFTAPEARLFIFTANVSPPTQTQVRVAHEALLTHWPPAKQSIEDDRADLELEARLDEASRRWSRSPVDDRKTLLLPRGLPLEEARDLCSRRGDEIGHDVVGFVDASAAADESRRASEEAAERERSDSEAREERSRADAERERADAAHQIARATRRFLAVTLVLAVVALCVGAAGVAFGLRQFEEPQLTEISLSDAAVSLAADPPGEIVALEGSGTIARLDGDGVRSERTIFRGIGALDESRVAVSSDGTLWLARGSEIGKLASNGPVHWFQIPGKLPSRNNPKAVAPDATSITAGSDGMVWFTETQRQKIGRITSDGEIREFSTSGRKPSAIIGAPDGTSWFCTDLGEIGGASRSGLIRYIRVKDFRPIAVAFAADGTLWAADEFSGNLARIPTSGKVRIFRIRYPASSIAQGSDGAMWFTEKLSSEIGRISPDGALREFPTTELLASPDDITAGPDGALWFVENGARPKVGRITTRHFIWSWPQHM